MGHTARWLAVHVHVRETARRKIVKPIQPTNLYNVVRHFYRLATPLANNTSRGRKKGEASTRWVQHTLAFTRASQFFGMEMKDFMLS